MQQLSQTQLSFCLYAASLVKPPRISIMCPCSLFHKFLNSKSALRASTVLYQCAPIFKLCNSFQSNRKHIFTKSFHVFCRARRPTWDPKTESHYWTDFDKLFRAAILSEQKTKAGSDNRRDFTARVSSKSIDSKQTLRPKGWRWRWAGDW